MALSDSEIGDKQIISDDKYSRFKKLYDDLEGPWDRENFDRKIRKVEDAIDSIEDVIEGLQDDLAQIVGKRGYESEYDKVKEELAPYNEDSDDFYKEIRDRDVRGKSLDLHDLRELDRERLQLLRKIAEWRSLQFEFTWLAAKKEKRVLSSMKEKLVSGELYERFDEKVESEIDRLQDFVDDRVDRKFESKMREVELLKQELENQMHFQREITERAFENMNDREMAGRVQQEMQFTPESNGAQPQDRDEFQASRLDEEETSEVQKEEDGSNGYVQPGESEGLGTGFEPPEIPETDVEALKEVYENYNYAEVENDGEIVYQVKESEEVEKRADILHDLLNDPNTKTDTRRDLADHTDMNISSLFYGEHCVLTKIEEELDVDLDVP